MSILRLIPILLLVPALVLADNDKNFKIQPDFFKVGSVVDPIKESPLRVDGSVMVSQKLTFPLKENALYLRHKKGPKEYQWVQGTVNVEHYKRFHAFNLDKNRLSVNEVACMRFYGTQNSKAFQDETDLYFDREYIYSTRIPKLFFIKNGRWQQLKEDELPGLVEIVSDEKDFGVSSFDHAMERGTRFITGLPSGPYSLIFSAPNSLSYVDIEVVKSGEVVKFTPKFVKVDTSAAESVKISVRASDVQATKSLEETEVLYDKFMAELKASVDRVDMSEFEKAYPVMKDAMSLGLEEQDLGYKSYVARFTAKKNEAKEFWGDLKLKGLREVTAAFHHKLDSLQALPLRGMMMPATFEPVYDTIPAAVQPVPSSAATLPASAASAAPAGESVQQQVPEAKLMLKAIKLRFGVEGGRYDVTWTGVANGTSVDSLYSWFFNHKAGFKVYITLENNKPVWTYNEDVVAGRYQYRYTKVEFEADGQMYQGQGAFTLPENIFEQKEVQDWLNREILPPAPVSSSSSQAVITESSSSVAAVVEMPKNFDPNMPKIIRDKDRGSVVMLDSGSFRYYGKVVAMSPFAIMTEEFTQQMYEKLMMARDSASRIPDKSTFKDPQKPVHNVNWNDARGLCQSLGGDLPTEAQWEYAARAGSNEGAIWVLDSNPDPGVYAVYRENSYKKNKKDEAYGPQKVGSKKANAWGIHDMSGNVAEWTRDKYFMFSFWIEDSNPTGAMMGYSRVFKGGSWKDKESMLNLTESDDEDPRYWSESIGFRCVYPQDIIKE